MLRQQTWGNRLYFSSFPVPVLEDPTYVGTEGIPRVLGAEGAAGSARKIPSWRWGALPRVGPGQACPSSSFPWGGAGSWGSLWGMLAGASGCDSAGILPVPLPLPGGSSRSELCILRDFV